MMYEHSAASFVVFLRSIIEKWDWKLEMPSSSPAPAQIRVNRQNLRMMKVSAKDREKRQSDRPDNYQIRENFLANEKDISLEC